eukprot:13456609-Alexandrium_andersonii.AAC.1
MSASLVGSEMCIRDSCCRASGAAPSQRPRRGQPPRSGPRWPAPLPQPVSYTHLTLPTICSV